MDGRRVILTGLRAPEGAASARAASERPRLAPALGFRPGSAPRSWLRSGSHLAEYAAILGVVSLAFVSTQRIVTNTVAGKLVGHAESMLGSPAVEQSVSQSNAESTTRETWQPTRIDTSSDGEGAGSSYTGYVLAEPRGPYMSPEQLTDAMPGILGSIFPEDSEIGELLAEDDEAGLLGTEDEDAPSDEELEAAAAILEFNLQNAMGKSAEEASTTSTEWLVAQREPEAEPVEAETEPLEAEAETEEPSEGPHVTWELQYTEEDAKKGDALIVIYCNGEACGVIRLFQGNELAPGGVMGFTRDQQRALTDALFDSEEGLVQFYEAHIKGSGAVDQATKDAIAQGIQIGNALINLDLSSVTREQLEAIAQQLESIDGAFRLASEVAVTLAPIIVAERATDPEFIGAILEIADAWRNGEDMLAAVNRVCGGDDVCGEEIVGAAAREDYETLGLVLFGTSGFDPENRHDNYQVLVRARPQIRGIIRAEEQMGTDLGEWAAQELLEDDPDSVGLVGVLEALGFVDQEDAPERETPTSTVIANRFGRNSMGYRLFMSPRNTTAEEREAYADELEADAWVEQQNTARFGQLNADELALLGDRIQAFVETANTLNTGSIEGAMGTLQAGYLYALLMTPETLQWAAENDKLILEASQALVKFEEGVADGTLPEELGDNPYVQAFLRDVKSEMEAGDEAWETFKSVLTEHGFEWGIGDQQRLQNRMWKEAGVGGAVSDFVLTTPGELWQGVVAANRDAWMAMTPEERQEFARELWGLGQQMEAGQFGALDLLVFDQLTTEIAPMLSHSGDEEIGIGTLLTTVQSAEFLENVDTMAEELGLSVDGLMPGAETANQVATGAQALAELHGTFETLMDKTNAASHDDLDPFLAAVVYSSREDRRSLWSNKTFQTHLEQLQAGGKAAQEFMVVYQGLYLLQQDQQLFTEDGLIAQMSGALVILEDGDLPDYAIPADAESASATISQAVTNLADLRALVDARRPESDSADTYTFFASMSPYARQQFAQQGLDLLQAVEDSEAATLVDRIYTIAALVQSPTAAAEYGEALTVQANRIDALIEIGYGELSGYGAKLHGGMDAIAQIELAGTSGPDNRYGPEARAAYAARVEAREQFQANIDALMATKDLDPVIVTQIVPLLEAVHGLGGDGVSNQEHIAHLEEAKQIVAEQIQTARQFKDADLSSLTDPLDQGIAGFDGMTQLLSHAGLNAANPEGNWAILTGMTGDRRASLANQYQEFGLLAAAGTEQAALIWSFVHPEQTALEWDQSLALIEPGITVLEQNVLAAGGMSTEQVLDSLGLLSDKDRAAATYMTSLYTQGDQIVQEARHVEAVATLYAEGNVEGAYQGAGIVGHMEVDPERPAAAMYVLWSMMNDANPGMDGASVADAVDLASRLVMLSGGNNLGVNVFTLPSMQYAVSPGAGDLGTEFNEQVTAGTELLREFMNTGSEAAFYGAAFHLVTASTLVPNVVIGQASDKTSFEQAGTFLDTSASFSSVSYDRVYAQSFAYPLTREGMGQFSGSVQHLLDAAYSAVIRMSPQELEQAGIPVGAQDQIMGWLDIVMHDPTFDSMAYDSAVMRGDQAGAQDMITEFYDNYRTNAGFQETMGYVYRALQGSEAVARDPQLQAMMGTAYEYMVMSDLPEHPVHQFTGDLELFPQANALYQEGKTLADTGTFGGAQQAVGLFNQALSTARTEAEELRAASPFAALAESAAAAAGTPAGVGMGSPWTGTVPALGGSGVLNHSPEALRELGLAFLLQEAPVGNVMDGDVGLENFVLPSSQFFSSPFYLSVMGPSSLAASGFFDYSGTMYDPLLMNGTMTSYLQNEGLDVTPGVGH